MYAFDARALRRFFCQGPISANDRRRDVAAGRRAAEMVRIRTAVPELPADRRRCNAFWRAHAATLERAQNEFGVPAEIVVAIIGVETFYGRNTGSYRVAEAL